MDRNINLEEIKELAAGNHLLQESGSKTFCPVCSNNLDHFINSIDDLVSWVYPTQKAHFLSNDKPNKKKFGKIIVEDDLNHTLVCGLKCNNMVQVRNNPAEEQKILLEILNKHINNNPSKMDIKKLYNAWCYLGQFIIGTEYYEKMYNDVCSYFIDYERSIE